MAKDRVLNTLKFFDFQDYPLTLLEVGQFLVNDLDDIKVDNHGELLNDEFTNKPKISTGQILEILHNDLSSEVENFSGLYFLKGRKSIAESRLKNYYFGIYREKQIKKYTKFLKYIPFVRGAALAGSQAMGQQKESSDIDLFIITNPTFMWLSRTLVTAYFQLLGQRRHNLKITNRFCLNHYLAGAKKITNLRNLYTAHEYLKLRSLTFPYKIWEFQTENSWINIFFPNFTLVEHAKEERPAFQRAIESIFLGRFGLMLERMLKNWQSVKIRQEKYILVTEDELSFHPDSKQEALLRKFHKQN